MFKMKDLSTTVQKSLQNERGLATIEYAILGALVALGTVAIFTHLHGVVMDRIDLIASALVDNRVDGAAVDCLKSAVGCDN